MLDDLLKDLQAAGLADSSGQFTLNAAQARQKLQHYQFREPHEYVLSLYRCAVLSGARRVDCQVEADALLLEFDGDPLTPQDFLVLWGTLFMRQDDPSLARLRHLALGLNAVLEDAQSVVLESFGWGVRYQGGQEQAGPARTGEKTRIQVRQRAGWGLARRFLQQLRDQPPEGQLLRERCRRGAPTTRVNRQACNEPPSRPTVCLAQAWVESADPRNRFLAPPEAHLPTLHLERDFSAWLALTPGPAQVEFVVAGVSSGQRRLAADLVGTVSSAHLVLDVSQRELVEDERYLELREQILEVRGHLVAALASAYPAGLDPSALPAAREYLLRAAEAVDPRAPRQEAERAVVECPLIGFLDGHQGSLAEVARRNLVRYTRRSWDLPGELVADIVLLEPADEQLQMFLLGHFHLVCADDWLEQLEIGLMRKREWEEAPEGPVQLAEQGAARVPLVGVAGEMTLVERGSRHCMLYKQARPLLKLALDGPGLEAFPPGIVAAARHDDLEMDSHWQKLQPNAAYQQICAALRQGVVDLFARLPWLTSGQPVWHFLAFMAAHPQVAPWPARGAVAEIPFVQTTVGKPLSLAQLEELRLRLKALYWLSSAKLVSSALANPPFPILELSREQVQTLAAALPPETLRPAEEHPAVKRLMTRHRFLRRSVGTGLRGPFLIRRDLPQGFLAVPLTSSCAGLEVWITCERREICRLTLDWPTGPLAVETEVPPGVEIDGDWQGILPGPAWEEWLEDLREETRQLGAELVRGYATLSERAQPRAQRFLLRLLASEARRCSTQMLELDSDPVCAQLMAAPLLTDLQGRAHSCQSLLKSSPRLGFVSEPQVPPAELRETVLLVPSDQVADLLAIFGPSRVVNRSKQLEVLARSEQPVVDAKLPPGAYVSRRDWPEVRLGLLRDPSRPGQVLYLHQGREVERGYSYGDIPYAALIDHPVLQPNADWTRVTRNAAFQKVQQEIQAALVQAVDDLLAEGRELAYLIALFRGLSAYNPLRKRWGPRQVLSGWRDPLTLEEFERRHRVAGPPEWVSASQAEALRARVPADEWPLLTRGLKHSNPVIRPDQANLELLGRDVGHQLEETARELEFERQQRLALSLEQHWPAAEWLLRQPLEPCDGLKAGELGLLAEWEAPGLLRLAYKGVHVTDLDPELGLAVRGCLDGFFPPREGRPTELKVTLAARQLVLPCLARFLAAVVRDARLDEETRATILARAWHRLGPYASHLDEIRCLPLEGGRRADLRLLLSQRRVLWSPGSGEGTPEDGQPRRGDDLLLVLRPGSPLQRELAAALGRRLVALRAPSVADDPRPGSSSKPTLSAPRAKSDPDAQPAPGAEPALLVFSASDESPEDLLIQRLRGELRLLGEGRALALPEGYLAGLRLVRGPLGHENRLCWRDPQGLALNLRHRAVQRALADSRPRNLYLLLSALYSAANRAEAEITDAHEREFHGQILATLLGD